MITDIEGNTHKIVYSDGDYIVIFGESTYCNGYRVCKKRVIKGNKVTYNQVNPGISFFVTLKAAIKFIKEDKKALDK